jgi:hypothetical protein
MGQGMSEEQAYLKPNVVIERLFGEKEILLD